MSKKIARNPSSYLSEAHTLSIAPILFEGKGFTKVTARKKGSMKFIDAHRSDGTCMTFWLKQGWTNAKEYCAIQFGLFGKADPGQLTDDMFIDYVHSRVLSAQRKGATHALMVHKNDGIISSYIAMNIIDVSKCFSEQISGWPKRARSTKTPTLYFEDFRDLSDATCASVVQRRALSLESIVEFGIAAQPTEKKSASKQVTVEMERRMVQHLFREKVGDRHGWKCAVSGFAVREVLDAAHLPGKDWRWHNEAEDGVLLRADLHRLLDRDKAEIRNGQFWLKKEARLGPYAEFHKSLLRLSE